MSDVDASAKSRRQRVVERHRLWLDERRKRLRGGRHSVVYFIGCGDFIKIGLASSLRRSNLFLSNATPYPLVVLATVSGDRRTEKRIHRRFDAARHKGEWFRKTPELLALIDQINSAKGAT